MKYRLIKGVRFQKGVPKKYIDSFFGKKETPEKFRFKEDDDLCYMEHRVVGGSAPCSLRPLTPYSILSGNRTVEEVAKKRRRQGSMAGRYVIDSANNCQEIYGGENGGDILLRIPKSIQQTFFDMILALEAVLIDPKYPTFYCRFTEPKFDPRNNRIILPNISMMNGIKLARKFASKIRLKEILANENDGIRLVVDQKGWRVDLM